MSDSSADRDPLDRLAEEFVERFRAGKRPSLTEFADRLPGREDEVRDLFPALVEMEQLKPVTADQTGAFVPAAGPGDPERVGEFRILRRVGVGGMGVVYEAVQESLGRHVALKLLPIDALADPKRLERFRREAKAAAKLHHTNVVPVFGTGEADGRHFYAMQFTAGHPLDAVIDEVRRLKDHTAAPAGRAVSEVAAALATGTFAAGGDPDSGPAPAAPGSPSSLSVSDGGRYWGTVARLGAQVADALTYAHAQGVLHRDIKPANLLLDLRGTVWVTDFGLAKANDTDDLTHAGDFVGTLRYMAPERFDGSGDGRADTYALGLTLYELLTLKPAFVADTRAKLVEQVIAASPKPPRAVNPAIPRDLETIVLKAIQRDPAMRYQTAAELADDLRRFTEDRPILARRASAAEQAWRWCRRNPAVASLLAAVVICLAVVTGLATTIAVQQSEAQKEANRSRKEANARLAALSYERGQELCEKGRIGPGLHSLLASWRAARAADDADWMRLARTNLSAWKARFTPFRAVLDHSASVLCVAYSPDKTTIATGSSDGTVKFWNSHDGQLLGEIRRHTSEVLCIDFHPDGASVATGHADGTVECWKVADGRPTGTPIVADSAIEGMEFSPDGLTIIAGSRSGMLKRWDVASGRVAYSLSLKEGLITGGLSPDGKTLVTCSGNKAQLWNATTGEPLGRV